ncbi:transcription antitermination factor NusB [Malaciobacter mytili]|uniref:Transcription antitermination protein NusB n=1 Tax=Malaciobacter mytili LMG 24559 TaxID=1032238 RepID=A0AAX2AE45_9BACT|nr:transcription antitermination factor NusB [Malaciobacter mytili]AXH15571.1 transcription antitermination protein [Malaciobacter mytili LMG 24559]RXI38233.1 transcription antitermination factor NusB [Malaciobacter mytili]RXK12944.1 transcription antitermination factor NusB [Malaciobacter mytili LMG 24559]
MATRTQARESVIGLLYAVDLGNDGIIKYVDDLLEDKKIRNKQKDFALNLFNGVINNLEVIDNEIQSHLNQGGLNDLGNVEKAILRLAVYETLFEKLDKPIIINEAIELAKRLASDNAPKFINGVLDKVKRA